MNKETYEALKRVMGWANNQDISQLEISYNDLLAVNEWIDEVSKEYQEGGEQE